MTCETESEIKSLKEELQRIEKELLAAISIHEAAQSTNHTCIPSSEKNPVSSLDVQYSVFFLWEAKKLLQQKLSIPVLLIVNWLYNSSISCSSIVSCERLETRLKKSHLGFCLGTKY